MTSTSNNDRRISIRFLMALGIWWLRSFQGPLSPLSIYVQNSSTPLTLNPLDVPSPPSRSRNDNQSIKKIYNPRMTIICHHVLPSGWLSFSVSTHLIWLSFDFFSFSWSLTICLFVALYSCVCSYPNISRNVFYL